MARQNYESALDYLKNAARLDDQDQDTFMDLGDLYVQLRNPDEAAQAYSQVAALVPNTPMAMEAQRRARKAMGFSLN
jgi:Flp pilus assembly protein TadD